MASKRSILEASVDIIHHCGVSNGVLRYKAQYYGTETLKYGCLDLGILELYS